LGRNDNLNYYKFGLGLGVSADVPSLKGGKKGQGGAAEASAGAADQ